MNRPTAIAILPVRVDSQRLPGKALLAESGQPLFVHTLEAARSARSFDRVWVATDDDRVAAAAERAGAGVVRTTSRPRTGSERCAEALAEIGAADIIVDVQGDWPEVDPADLDAVVAELAAGRRPMATLASPLHDPDAIADPNVVKVVRARDGSALYFSRSPVPHVRPGRSHPVLRHIGVYGFTRTTLESITALPSSGLAEAEGLEQLRFLENGIAIAVLDARRDAQGIETRADYDRFLQRRRRHPT
ncbi:MAG TPA: 3-deoxy-manno-octulosonate cytidylyltransferase [Planctomycetota bacterium]|nr:3-deoxy-manno-octulosonate cytidylyltransferase [Planctomycetota bacterium]